MDRTAGLGAALTALGASGYAAALVVSYPGRALSVTATMVGVTLLAVGLAGNGEEPE